MTTTKTTSKYTKSMEAAIAAAAPLDLVKATELAKTPEFVKAGVTARGIAAKARSMGVDYVKQERKAKDGSAVAKKDEIVAQLEAHFGVTFKSLAKAEKADLKALRDCILGDEVDAEETDERALVG